MQSRDEKIRKLAAAGLSNGVIAARLGISRSTVWRILDRGLDGETQVVAESAQSNPAPNQDGPPVLVHD